jgi:heat shock protein HslJ
MCASAQSNALTSRKWVLTEMNGNKTGETTAFIKFSSLPARFSGNSGCNLMSGNAHFRGNRLSFSEVVTTKRACMQGKPSLVDGQVSRLFGQNVRYTLRGNSLALQGADGLALRFEGVLDDKRPYEQEKVPVAKISTATLDNRKWTLSSIAGRAVGDEAKEAFLVFDPVKGNIGGNTSCNVFGGNYTAKDNKLKITQTISTMRACIEDNRMQIERSFLDGLQDANRYEIRDDKLYIRKGSRELLVFYGKNK